MKLTLVLYRTHGTTDHKLSLQVTLPNGRRMEVAEAVSGYDSIGPWCKQHNVEPADLPTKTVYLEDL